MSESNNIVTSPGWGRQFLEECGVVGSVADPPKECCRIPFCGRLAVRFGKCSYHQREKLKRSEVLSKRDENRAQRKKYGREFVAKVKRSISQTGCTSPAEEVLAAYTGQCCICQREETKRGTEGRAALRLDHDHATGKFRGWLCHQCNVMIGMARDNPATLIAAAKYLSATAENEAIGAIAS